MRAKRPHCPFAAGVNILFYFCFKMSREKFRNFSLRPDNGASEVFWWNFNALLVETVKCSFNHAQGLVLNIRKCNCFFVRWLSLRSQDWNGGKTRRMRCGLEFSQMENPIWAFEIFVHWIKNVTFSTLKIQSNISKF